MPDIQYFFASGNEQRGPHTAGEIIVMGLRPDTLVWREGLPDWQRMDSLPELIELIPKAKPATNVPPPVPPQSPPPYAQPVNYSGAPPRDDSKRIMAGLFGIFLGGLGIHKFILGYNTAGVIMLLVSLLSCGIASPIMHVIGLIEGIIYLCKSEDEFYRSYVVVRREWF